MVECAQPTNSCSFKKVKVSKIPSLRVAHMTLNGSSAQAVPCYLQLPGEEDGNPALSNYDVMVLKVADDGKIWKLTSQREMSYKQNHEVIESGEFVKRPLMTADFEEVKIDEKSDVTPVWVGDLARGNMGVSYDDQDVSEAAFKFRQIVSRQTVAWKAVIGSSEKEKKRDPVAKLVTVPEGVGNK